jgi:outer membrane protein TolC
MNNKTLILSILALASSICCSAQALQLSNAQCREMAVNASEDLKKSTIDYQQAGLDLDIAKKAYLPSVDAIGLLEYITPNMSMSAMELQMKGMYAAGIGLTQPIYTGGKLTAGKRLATIGTDIAQQKVRLSQMEVISGADNAYWTLVAVDAKVKMLHSYVTQMDSIYAQTQRAHSVGMVTRNDLLRIDARRSEITYNLKKAINGRQLCRLALCRIIGVSEETDITPTDTAITVSEPATMYNDISNRPELAILNYATSANEQQVKMAKADYLPTVGLSLGYYRYGNIKTTTAYQNADGSLGQLSSTINDGLGAAMLSVKIPIFNWGSTGKKVRKARYEVEKSQLDLEKNRRLMSIEAQQAINNVNDGYEMVAVANTALTQARENLSSMQARYNVSMCTLTDLLDAQSQWQQAESNLIEAKSQYKIYETEYLRVTGNL